MRSINRSRVEAPLPDVPEFGLLHFLLVQGSQITAYERRAQDGGAELGERKCPQQTVVGKQGRASPGGDGCKLAEHVPDHLGRTEHLSESKQL